LPAACTSPVSGTVEPSLISVGVTPGTATGCAPADATQTAATVMKIEKNRNANTPNGERVYRRLVNSF
jgi:hypothetical protein